MSKLIDLGIISEETKGDLFTNTNMDGKGNSAVCPPNRFYGRTANLANGFEEPMLFMCVLDA